MCQKDLYDAARRRLNEKSMGWASRRKVAWTPEEDAVILNEWVLVAAAQRGSDVEMEIARRLSRTLFACQGRAEHLRGVLDFSTPAASRTAAPAPRPTCPRCHMETTPSGACPMGCDD